MMPAPLSQLPLRRHWWQRAQDKYRSSGWLMREAMIVGLICASLCIVCFACTITSVALVAVGVIPPYTTAIPTDTPMVQTQSNVPTRVLQHPAPTAKPTTIPPRINASPDPLVSGPYLGGPDSTFHKVFTQTTDVAHLSGTVAGYQVEMYIRDGQGTDGQGRIREIEVTNWSGADSNVAGPAISKALLPPDAQYLEDVVGTGTDTWLRHVYRSPSIARSIPADDLAYDFGGTPPTPPGNAEWYCYSYYSSTPSECIITT